MDPVRGFVGGLELGGVGKQVLPQGRRFVWTQNRPGRPDDLPRSPRRRRRRRPFFARFGWSQSRGYPAPVSGAGLVGGVPFRAFGKVRRVKIISPAMPTRVNKA